MSSKNSLKNLIDHAAEIGVKLDAYVRGKNLHLEIIERTTAAKGQGDVVMRRLCALADQYGLTIRLYVFSYDPKLEAYYESFGFETDPDKGDEAYMCRYPKRLHEAQMVDEINRTNYVNSERIIKSVYDERAGMKFFGEYDGVRVFAKSEPGYMFFLLQKDKKTIGAAIMQKHRFDDTLEGWYMSEIAIRDAYRFNGYGYEFYKFLLCKKGFTIFSGGTQTEAGENVWKKLINDHLVTIKAIKMVTTEDEDRIEYVDVNQIDPWADGDIRLVATKNDLYESAMVDEIVHNVKSIYEPKVDQSLKSAVKVGSMGAANSIDIYKVDEEYGRRYLLVTGPMCKKPNSVIAAVELGRMLSLGWVAKPLVKENSRGKGFGFALYKFIIMHEGLTLISGAAQTDGGRGIWKKLMSDPDIDVKTLVDYADLRDVDSDPWDGSDSRLVAKRKSVNESVMVDEITTNDWWNMSDADMDTRLDVIDMNSLDYFDDIDSEYSVYTKRNKFYIYDKKAKRLIGYADIETSFLKGRQHIEVDEIALRPAYRKKNVAYNFYLMLLSLGYIVASGASQTKGGASIWKRLMNDPRIKVTAFGLDGDIDPADAWHEHYARLKAEMVSESKIVEGRYAEPIGDDDVKHGINYVVRHPMKIFGVIKDNVVISKGHKGNELVFLFSKGREAAGYANGYVSTITIDDKKYEVLTITDIGMYEKFKKQGIGFDFYNMLMENGYVLMNDETQTVFGEKLWKKLMRQNGIGVTTIKRVDSRKKNDYEHVDMVADDPWSMKNVRILIQAGNQEITEGQPRVAVIEPQPKGLERCTAVTCNAILAHYKRPLIKSAGAVPRTAKACFRLLQHFRLKVQPDITAPQKHMTVKTFVNLHQNGVWFIGVPGHAMAVIDGELFDTENKGLDNRLVRVIARIVT